MKMPASSANSTNSKMTAEQTVKGVQAEEVNAKKTEAPTSTAATSTEKANGARIVRQTLQYLRGNTLVNEFGVAAKSKL